MAMAEGSKRVSHSYGLDFKLKAVKHVKGGHSKWETVSQFGFAVKEFGNGATSRMS